MIREDFAGAGGCSEGKRLAGVTGEVVGVETDRHAVATARAAGHNRLHLSVQAARDIGWGNLDGYTAGPPCQTFSAAGGGSGRKALDHLLSAATLVARDGALPEEAVAQMWDEALDERSVLVLEPVLVVRRHRPRWILLEQVPAVLPIWERLAELFSERWGYHVTTGVLNAEQYGVPQTRRRAILMARLDRPVALPTPTHSRFYPRDRTRLDPGVKEWVSMAEALGRGMTERPSMTVMGGGTATGGAEPFGNQARAGMRRELDAGRWEMGDVRSSRGTRMNVSVQEAAILQTFPADYPWQGNLGAQYQQVGNAVPPLLSAACIRPLIS